MAKYDFKTQRIFVDADLDENTEIATDRQQSNYLLNVLRLRDGDHVLLFNGRDGEWLAGIERAGRKEAVLACQEQTRPQPAAYDLHYYFAPLKQARLDYMVQKAVEMGAGVLQPVFTHHTQVTRINTDRMAANAREAAEQCGILSLPECLEPVKLEHLIANWPADRHLIFADESAAEIDPLKALETVVGKRLGVLVGPEGGFSQDERQMLLEQKWLTAISLGPRILRADTAAVATLTLVQAVCGDLAGNVAAPSG